MGIYLANCSNLLPQEKPEVKFPYMYVYNVCTSENMDDASVYGFQVRKDSFQLLKICWSHLIFSWNKSLLSWSVPTTCRSFLRVREDHVCWEFKSGQIKIGINICKESRYQIRKVFFAILVCWRCPNKLYGVMDSLSRIACVEKFYIHSRW